MSNFMPEELINPKQLNYNLYKWQKWVLIKCKYSIISICKYFDLTESILSPDVSVITKRTLQALTAGSSQKKNCMKPGLNDMSLSPMPMSFSHMKRVFVDQGDATSQSSVKKFIIF